MAVVKNKRKKSDLEVYNLSIHLLTHAVKLYSNEKVIPKKLRYSLGNRILDSAYSVSVEIEFANSIYVKTKQEFIDRQAAQNRAIAHVNALLVGFDVLYRNIHTSERKMTHWTRLALEVRNLLRAWKNSEYSKYAEQFDMKSNNKKK